MHRARGTLRSPGNLKVLGSSSFPCILSVAHWLLIQLCLVDMPLKDKAEEEN